MNELEREYSDSVERSKRNEGRSRLFFIAWYGAFAVILSVVGMIVDDFSARGAMAFISASGVALFVPGLLLAQRLQKWFEDCKVVGMTTEREQAYRAPVAITDTQALVSRRRHLIASVPLAVVVFGGAVMDFCSPRTSLLESFVIVSTLFVFAGIGITIRAVYGIWRTRRNARLELKWEKWLASADACQVGPRKWTK